MAVNKQQIYNIVLVGKTGSGKSATGNTLLGRKTFTTSSNSSSCTADCQLESVRMGDIIINVIDTPGLIDTKKSRQEILDKMTNVMSLCPEGFHAFILVMRWDVRYTPEEIEAYSTIKKFFGPDFLKICLIAFTRGESYEMSDENGSFDDWLKRQEGELPKLLKECGGRNILFYNAVKYGFYEEKRKQVVDKLLKSIKEKKMLYSNVHFTKAVKEREKMAIKDNLPQLQAKYQRQLSLLEVEIDSSLKNGDNGDGGNIQGMKQVANHILQLISGDDKETGLLKDFEKRVKELIKMIDSLESTQKSKAEKLQKLAEYTKLIKNPPSKVGIVLSSLGLVGTVVGGSLLTAFTAVIPPLAIAVAGGTAAIAATSAGAIASNALNLKEYNRKLKELQDEIKD